MEVYNIPSKFFFDNIVRSSSDRLYIEFNGDFKHNHPPIIEKNLPEIEEFARVRVTRSSSGDGLTEFTPAVLTLGNPRSAPHHSGTCTRAPRGLLPQHPHIREEKRGESICHHIVCTKSKSNILLGPPPLHEIRQVHT